MAKIETPAEAPAADVFELTEDQLVSIAKRGRKETPSKYVADIEKAKAAGKPFGVAVPADGKATTVISELRRGAKQLGVKVRIFDRSTEAKPYIGFQVVEVDAAADAK